MKAFSFAIVVVLVGVTCKQALADTSGLEQCLSEVETSFESLESPERLEKLAQDLESVPYEQRFNNRTGKPRAFEMKFVKAAEKRSIERLCKVFVFKFKNIASQTDCGYELIGAIDPWINVNGYTEIAQKYQRISKIVDNVQACIDLMPNLRNAARNLDPCLTEAEGKLAKTRKIPSRVEILAENLMSSNFESKVSGVQISVHNFSLEEAKKFDMKMLDELTELCPIYKEEIFDTITSTECGTKVIDWTEAFYNQFYAPTLMKDHRFFEEMSYFLRVCAKIESSQHQADSKLIDYKLDNLDLTAANGDDMNNHRNQSNH